MAKVLISDKMSPLAEKIFRQRGLDVDFKPGMSKEELLACIGDYDGLAIRSSTKVTADVLEAATKLKVIARAGIGVDNVDIPAASSRGVIVMNTPFGNSITTAEHAIAMMFAVARQIPAADRSTQAGKWEKTKFMGTELFGKTLGLIGAGNIGSIVADRAQGLKMKVIAFDPFLSPERAEECGMEKVELDEVLERADFITLHTPLTDSTRGILNAAAFAKMKDGVRIVNCARGGLVDEEALANALKTGKVAGAAFDVFSVEPAKENVLFGMDNVVCTPHLGASTTEAQENVAIQVAEQIADYLLTGAITNALNTPSVSAEDAPRLRPYMALASQLGSFAGQITETGISGIEIEYQGAAAELNTKPLTAIVLQGILSPLMDSVNMVNAPLVAKEREIGVKVSTSEGVKDFQTLVRVTVKTERQQRSVAGTLSSNAEPRLVDIHGIQAEVKVGPNMIYMINEDKPGIIGAVGGALGDAGVNIANFTLGRDNEGGEALALIEVDGAPSSAIMEKLAGLQHVKRVKALSF